MGINMNLIMEIVCAFAIVVVADVLAYSQAKYPERAQSVLYKFPLGGFVALIKFGKD